MANRRKSDGRHWRAGTYRPDRGHGRRPLATAGEGIGEVPGELVSDSEAAAAWAQIAEAAPWLGQADRLAAEVAARALAALRRASEVPAALLSQVSKSLAALGLSPAARGETASIVIPRVEEPDPLEVALGRFPVAVTTPEEEAADRRAIQARKLEVERRRLALEKSKKDAN